MDLSLFKVLVKRKPTQRDPNELHGVLYTDGKGWLYDIRPNKLAKKEPLFDLGDVLEIEESLQTIRQVEAIPPITDQVINSIWEGALAYSSSGFFGFRYFIGARIYA